MTPTFARIRFVLPRDRRVISESERITISHADLPLTFELVGLDAGGIGKSANLVIRSETLPSPTEAASVGQRARIATMIAATRERLGVDFGKDGPKGMWMEHGLQMLRAQHQLPDETTLLNDNLGLMLVDAGTNPRFVSTPTAQVTIGTPMDRFVDAFVQGFAFAPAVTDRAALALELFAASRFEASLRARFLTLVAAIESIAERSDRDSDALALVRSFRQQLKDSGVNRTDQQQLVGALRDLKRRSITSSCKAVVEMHCGAEKAELFGECYNARSELVHIGRTAFDLGSNTQPLENLVSETIVKFIAHVA